MIKANFPSLQIEIFFWTIVISRYGDSNLSIVYTPTWLLIHHYLWIDYGHRNKINRVDRLSVFYRTIICNYKCFSLMDRLFDSLLDRLSLEAGDSLFMYNLPTNTEPKWTDRPCCAEWIRSSDYFNVARKWRINCLALHDARYQIIIPVLNRVNHARMQTPLLVLPCTNPPPAC